MQFAILLQGLQKAILEAAKTTPDWVFAIVLIAATLYLAKKAFLEKEVKK